MLCALFIGIAAADTSAPADAPTLEQRLANLEAYVTNSVPDAKGGALAATSGPGHNGWMMTCAALVLFMTLPGLALFYGGLVRRKNVLSVLAQCFGCAGLVTILWWAVGYSLAFAPGSPFLGGLDVRAASRASTSAPNADYAALGLAERVLDVPADVRDHHAGADRRRDRRAHEVLGDHGCSSRCGCSSSTSRSRTWCGASTAS